MAELGAPAPEFTLEGTAGKSYGLTTYRGRWVVLAFYPADFTAVCTRQFCSYRDQAETLARLDAEVLGISPQSVDSHERFVSEHSLNVPLLADPDKEVARAYGALLPGGIVRRSIFIVDPEGILRFEDVSLLGLRYRSAGEISEELEKLRRAA